MPSILPEYEYDIFISYRQKDNKYDGWVTEFVNNLQNELDSTFKEEVSIYFDENPHDGLLETHNVDKSLEGKLKCLVLIPIISRTYCDPKSFAWQNEFLAFLEEVTKDNHGKSVQLADGNIADRVLPVQIHDIDKEDQVLFEEAAGSVLRPVPFIYKLPGVNRQLRAIDDDQIKSPDQILYRDQVNKVAQAIKEIIGGMSQDTGNAVGPIIEKKEKPVLHSKVDTETEIPKQKSLSKKSIIIALIVLPLLIIGLFGSKYLNNWFKVNKAKTEWLPKIEKLADENFRAPVESFKLGMAAYEILGDDSALMSLMPRISTVSSMLSDPPGVEVYWKDYNTPDAEWEFAGLTPFDTLRLPRVFLRMEFRKEGYHTVQYAGPWAYGGVWPDIRELKMTKIADMPVDMNRIPTKQASMYIVGLEQNGGKNVPEFLMDKYEVSNKDFKSFLDEGGYGNTQYWQHKFILQAKEISHEEAKAYFVDQTGRQGPATWVAGTYPDGEEDHPVTGVSWYEAAAYAAYRNKSLPTIYHWANVAATSRTEFIIPFSNFNGKGTVPVGNTPGYHSFGIYDIAGNVREWCFNETGSQRFILGGGYNDPIYAFNDGYSQDPMDRSLSNGFRCIQLLDSSNMQELTKPVEMAFRDYRKESPVDDETFNLFARQYMYDNIPLKSEVAPFAENDLWTTEKISFEAAYNQERMQAYLYKPKGATEPLQPIIFWPGSGDIYQRKFYAERIGRVEFLLKSGRAVIYPILKGTFERHDELNSDLQDETVFYKDHVIMWRKDIGRIIDYLETRDDIDVHSLGFLGWSWGGFMGGIIPALEKRIKAVVLNVGGMEMQRALPEVDQLNFLPRVTQPVLMLNGKHDMFFPLETSQKPMFDFLGTPEKDKKMIVYESGHLVPKMDFVKESLAWYDTYLGPTK